MVNQLSKEVIVFLVLAILAVGYVVMDAQKNQVYSSDVAGQVYNFKIDDTSLVKKYTPHKNMIRLKNAKDLVTYCPTYATKDYSKKYGMKTSLACNYALSTSPLSKKKLKSFYSCFFDPLPLNLEKSACPLGSELNKFEGSIIFYECRGTAPFVSSCLSGYELAYDFSQKKEAPGSYYSGEKQEYVPLPNYYKIGCVKQGVTEKFPCGNSGALVIPTPSYEGYCCGFFEK